MGNNICIGNIETIQLKSILYLLTRHSWKTLAVEPLEIFKSHDTKVELNAESIKALHAAKDTKIYLFCQSTFNMLAMPNTRGKANKRMNRQINNVDTINQYYLSLSLLLQYLHCIAIVCV